MQLDRIEVVVRPRNPWESIDLGFSMVWQWWKPLYKLWFAIVLPLFLLLYLLFYDSLWIAVLIIWWLKPFLDRILLHFFSHALFGEQPGIWQTIKALPNLLKTRLFLALGIWRFDLARSFNLPIWQLEGSRNNTDFQRKRLLQKNTRKQAVWLTIVCLHFELLIYVSVFGLVYMMVPVYQNSDLLQVFLYEEALWLEILNIISSLIALSIIEPLYVAAGFALYINRRTHLEAWDIELAFRRIAEHLVNNPK